jgi:hypothetical protein
VLQGLATPVRGEIMFVIEAGCAGLSTVTPMNVQARIDALLAENQSVACIAKQLASQGFGQRRALYALGMQRKRLRQDVDLRGKTPRG